MEEIAPGLEVRNIKLKWVVRFPEGEKKEA